MPRATTLLFDHTPTWDEIYDKLRDQSGPHHEAVMRALVSLAERTRSGRLSLTVDALLEEIDRLGLTEAFERGAAEEEERAHATL